MFFDINFNLYITKYCCEFCVDFVIIINKWKVCECSVNVFLM